MIATLATVLFLTAEKLSAKNYLHLMSPGMGSGGVAEQPGAFRRNTSLSQTPPKESCEAARERSESGLR